jgi:hypothetical protein
MSFHKLLLLVLFTLSPLHLAPGFVEPVSLGKQVKQADAILRVVVVDYEVLKINKDEAHSFQAIAKCRIIEDYKGDYKGGKFILIPCSYNFDEDPSPIDSDGDYVVLLETMKMASLGHPVAWNAVHPVTIDKVEDPDDPQKEIPLAELVKRIKALVAEMKK